jgi:hypothetical protein
MFVQRGFTVYNCGSASVDWVHKDKYTLGAWLIAGAHFAQQDQRMELGSRRYGTL